MANLVNIKMTTCVLELKFTLDFVASGEIAIYSL